MLTQFLPILEEDCNVADLEHHLIDMTMTEKINTKSVFLTAAVNSLTIVTIWCISVATCCLYSTSWWYLGACTQLGKAGACCEHITTRIPKEVYQVEKLGNMYIYTYIGILKSSCLVFSLMWLRGSMAGGSVLLAGIAGTQK